jgi:hypothetical protein
MNGVPAHDLQQATLASIGMVFGQIASVSEVDERLRTSLVTSDHRLDG